MAETVAFGEVVSVAVGLLVDVGEIVIVALGVPSVGIGETFGKGGAKEIFCCDFT